MISYEINPSSYFKANESYCLEIEQLFENLNLECEGECNSWGYEFYVSLVKNNISFDFKFYKETITRSGSIVPQDSAISEGLDIEISPLNKSHQLKIQQSNFKRLFMTKELKEMVPSPYYFTTNVISQNEVTKWVSLFEKYEMYLLKLKNGKLVLEINHRVEEPLKLISELEPMIKFYI